MVTDFTVDSFTRLLMGGVIGLKRILLIPGRLKLHLLETARRSLKFGAFQAVLIIPYFFLRIGDRLGLLLLISAVRGLGLPFL